ncbi:MAG: acetate--CoA ligase family protein [Alphaproteobacteria bacterium]|nr:acetate--CoA ligase family protein [Alphaproteobacteria bacterium]
MPLEALLAPKSIAILGASPKPTIGLSLIQTLDKMGFTGAIYPVNPKYEDVGGRKCYPTIDALPDGVDLVLFCISSKHLLAQYEAAARKRIGSAAVYDGGFAEAGEEGKSLQARIADLSREAGMALCGPNCMGALNPPFKSTSYMTSLADPLALVGDVALISQSGSICIGMVADVRRFGYSHVISSGNEAATTTAQYLEYLIDELETKVIALFTESVREPDRFVAALDRAADKGKPVIVLKVGKSTRSSAVVSTHTGGLAGESRVFSALLKAHRAIEVDDMDEFTEVIAVCRGSRLPKGNRIAVVAASGGQSELVLDLATAHGLNIPPLKPELKQKAEAVIGPLLGDGNPLDAWGHGEYKVNIPHAFDCLGTSPDFDAIAYIGEGMDNQPTEYADKAREYCEMMSEAAAKYDKPFYFMGMRSGIFRSDQVRMLAKDGMALIGGTRQGLGAIARVAQYVKGPGQSRPPAAPATLKIADVTNGRVRPTIHEFDAKRLLAAAGVPVAKERLVTSAAEAKRAAAEIGYPVVLKVASDAIAHKTDAGLVAVGVKGESELDATWRLFEERIGRLSPRPAIDGFIVQQMVAGGVEVLAGVKRDPLFGLVMAFGVGGIFVELLNSVALRMLPLRVGDAEAMIEETAAKAVLAGMRSQPPADTAALARALYALSDYAYGDRDAIAEIDVNPIKVLPRGQGCVAVDALIVPRR